MVRVLVGSRAYFIIESRLEAAIAAWPQEHFTLRQGIRLIREHPPNKSGG